MCRARLLVKKEGQFFSVEDTEVTMGRDGVKTPINDILFKPRVKTIQNVKSVLGDCYSVCQVSVT